MNRSLLLRILFIHALFIVPISLRSQSTEPVAGNIVTQWDNPLTVVPNTLEHNGVDFPAHTITVHGSKANSLWREWRSEMREQAAEVKGRKPIIARSAVIPSISPSPITVMGVVSGQRKDPFARLTVAFGENDTTPIFDNGSQERYMHELAVRYNDAVIQNELATKQKELKKAERRTAKGASDEKKTRKRLERAENKLARAQHRREKAEAIKAKREGDLVGIRRANASTEDVPDKRKVLRARREIAKREADVLKYMEQELEHQAEINEYRALLPEHDRTQKKRNAEVEMIEREINALESARENLK